MKFDPVDLMYLVEAMFQIYRKYNSPPFMGQGEFEDISEMWERAKRACEYIYANADFTEYDGVFAYEVDWNMLAFACLQQPPNKVLVERWCCFHGLKFKEKV